MIEQSSLNDYTASPMAEVSSKTSKKLLSRRDINTRFKGLVLCPPLQFLQGIPCSFLLLRCGDPQSNFLDDEAAQAYHLFSPRVTSFSRGELP